MTTLTQSTLDSQKVAGLLQRLFHAADENDPQVHARIRAANPEGVRNDALAREMLGSAYIPISPEGGRLLYILARSAHAKNIVEFGTSFGISAIHLAAAARDNGDGRVMTTEMHPEKVKRARKNLEEAGLSEYVEIREGDALETLAGLTTPIDFLFLDGWKELYLPVLKLLEPRLKTGALIIGDDLKIYPEVMKPYLQYVRTPANGYTSVELEVGDGLEISVRTA